MKIALKKGVRGAISQKAALGILIYIHQIHLFIIPVHEELSKFTEMKVTLEMNSALFVTLTAVASYLPVKQSISFTKYKGSNILAT